MYISNMGNFGIFARFGSLFEIQYKKKMYGLSLIYKNEHFAKTALKLDEHL